MEEQLVDQYTQVGRNTRSPTLAAPYSSCFKRPASPHLPCASYTGAYAWSLVPLIGHQYLQAPCAYQACLPCDIGLRSELKLGVCILRPVPCCTLAGAGGSLHAVQVERVVAERPGAQRCLLVKWEGLPYCECTWETEQEVMAAKGGPTARDDFLTRQQRLQVS